MLSFLSLFAFFGCVMLFSCTTIHFAMQAQSLPKPLLILSDSPDSGTGLGRICRDLATRIHEHMGDTFRVATVGAGGLGSRHLGFHQYHAEVRDWVVLNLPEIWEDFAGREKGYLFTIWDISRLQWLADPRNCEALSDFPYLKAFLLSKPFENWIYPPMDASGPFNRLTYPIARYLSGFDRIIAYSQWAAKIIDRSMGLTEGFTPSLPHGIDSSVFYERDRSECRAKFGAITNSVNLLGGTCPPIAQDEVLVGICATNQPRKDFALGIASFAMMAQQKKVRLWLKIDALERALSIPALLTDFGLVERTFISLGDMTDDELAQAYSACDVTMGIGLGEGFGYPIHESLFCGTPCVHGNYGGAPEYVRGSINGILNPKYDELVEPIAFRVEGVFSCLRPVLTPESFAGAALSCLGRRMNHNGDLDWNRLWPRWQAWFEEAAKQ